MSRRNLQLIAAIVVLLLATLACQFAFSSAKAENTRLASDPEGNSPTTSFGQEDTFYLLGELKNAPSDTKLKAVWTAVEVEGTAPETLLDEAEVQGSSGPFTFSLEKSQPIWPVGSYKVDLFLDDELNQTFEFQVERTVQAEIQNARLARDSEGVDITTSFTPSDTFHLLADLVNAPAGGMPVKTVWIAVQVEGAESQEIDTVIDTIENGPIVGTLTSSSGAWPLGQYRVELYLNEALAQSLDFEVIESGEPSSSSGAPSLAGLFLAKDDNGDLATSVFLPQESVYLHGELLNAPQGSQVEANWIAEDVEGYEPNEIISEPETFDATEGSLSINLVKVEGKDWTPGEYKVEALLNGEKVETLTFLISNTRIENSFMAKDQDGNQKTEVFGTQDPFYLLFDLVDAPDDTVVGTTWFKLKTDTTEEEQINESEYTFGTGSYYVRLTSDSGLWEPGEYEVALYLNGYYYSSLFFSVQ